MGRKKKQLAPEQFWDAGGQLRFVAVETFNGEQRRGFWAGEPRKSAFIELPEKPDRRGITPSLKHRVTDGVYPVMPTNVFDPRRSLKDENDQLIRENEELRKVVAREVERPVKSGAEGAKAAKRELKAAKAIRESAIIDAANKVLAGYPNLPRQNLTAAVRRKVNYSEPTVRGVLQQRGYVPKKNKNLAR